MRMVLFREIFFVFATALSNVPMHMNKHWCVMKLCVDSQTWMRRVLFRQFFLSFVFVTRAPSSCFVSALTRIVLVDSVLVQGKLWGSRVPWGCRLPAGGQTPLKENVPAHSTALRCHENATGGRTHLRRFVSYFVPPSKSKVGSLSIEF